MFWGRSWGGGSPSPIEAGVKPWQYGRPLQSQCPWQHQSPWQSRTLGKITGLGNIKPLGNIKLLGKIKALGNLTSNNKPSYKRGGADTHTAKLSVCLGEQFVNQGMLLADGGTHSQVYKAMASHTGDPSAVKPKSNHEYCIKREIAGEGLEQKHQNLNTPKTLTEQNMGQGMLVLRNFDT